VQAQLPWTVQPEPQEQPDQADLILDLDLARVAPWDRKTALWEALSNRRAPPGLLGLSQTSHTVTKETRTLRWSWTKKPAEGVKP
jgi:hypothetical protein